LGKVVGEFTVDKLAELNIDPNGLIARINAYY
jgi:hypothetical protein